MAFDVQLGFEIGVVRFNWINGCWSCCWFWPCVVALAAQAKGFDLAKENGRFGCWVSTSSPRLLSRWPWPRRPPELFVKKGHCSCLVDFPPTSRNWPCKGRNRVIGRGLSEGILTSNRWGRNWTRNLRSCLPSVILTIKNNLSFCRFMK